LYGRWLPIDKSAQILDIGCGAGILLEWFVGSGYPNAQGIDIDRSQIEFASHLGLKVECVPDSISWVQNSSTFDMIMMCDVLEHVSSVNDIKMLSSIHSALKDGGIFIVKVPNASSSFGTRARYIDPTHQRTYTEESLSFGLREAGFTSFQIEGDDVNTIRSLRGFSRLLAKKAVRFFRRFEAISEFGRTGANIILSHNLLAICRK
jgi:cyclopropane fatty-acyl-phospholipid synthase-like methyltransferase